MAHERFASCIEACNDCADTCDHCAAACLQESGVKDLIRCIRLDLDCAAMCRVAVGSMSRGSELAAQICEACAEACEACAEECERHKHMDHCRACAEACRRCAEECRRMVGATAKGGQQSRSTAHPH